LEGLEDDVLANGFCGSRVLLSDGRDGENLVALNGSIDTDAGAPPINLASPARYLARSFFTLYFDSYDLYNIHIRMGIIGYSASNLILRRFDAGGKTATDKVDSIFLHGKSFDIIFDGRRFQGFQTVCLSKNARQRS